MSEKELLDDILESFKLTKQSLKDLEQYERDLIYETYHRYDTSYLRNLLFRAKHHGYYNISNKIPAPEPKYPTRPTEYVVKYKPKHKDGDYKIEKTENKVKRKSL